MARILPGPAVEATQAATLSSFAVYAGMACWAFADRQVWRVWAFGALACAALAGALALSLQVEPRL